MEPTGMRVADIFGEARMESVSGRETYHFEGGFISYDERGALRCFASGSSNLEPEDVGYLSGESPDTAYRIDPEFSLPDSDVCAASDAIESGPGRILSGAYPILRDAYDNPVFATLEITLVRLGVGVRIALPDGTPVFLSLHLGDATESDFSVISAESEILLDTEGLRVVAGMVSSISRCDDLG